MYALIKITHSYWSFFVLIILLVAVLNAINGIVTGKDFGVNNFRISLFGLIFSHIQLLIGLVLYSISPWFEQWLSMDTEVMKKFESLLYLIEHPFTNIFAIFLITVGWSMHKRQIESSKKFLRIILFYSLGLIFLLSKIPWNLSL